MKASLKMTNSMAKVLYDLLTLTMFDDSIGKWFGNNGDKYEGEWKDGKRHSQCKKEVIYFLLH